MSELFESVTPSISTQEHYIWAEKYRPVSLDNYIGNETLKTTIGSYIQQNNIPIILFHGPAGTGKTTLAKLLANNIQCDSLYINASNENGIDAVRSKILDFASNIGFSELKVVILDEADYLTHSSQAALRNIMETYALTTRFILTCNYVEKISNPLISRCQCFEISAMDKKSIAIKLIDILNTEKVTFTIDDVGYIVNTYYPDIRKMINYSQQHVFDSVLKISEVTTAATINSIIIDALSSKENTITAATKIRQAVADNQIRQFEELYGLLFEKVSEYAPTKQEQAIIIIAEYLYQSALVVNREITFTACIVKLLQLRS
jgi:replication factor C small subunit